MQSISVIDDRKSSEARLLIQYLEHRATAMADAVGRLRTLGYDDDALAVADLLALTRALCNAPAAVDPTIMDRAHEHAAEVQGDDEFDEWRSIIDDLDDDEV